MKIRSILISLTMLLGVGPAMADNKLSIAEVTLPQGGETEIVIAYSLDKPCRDFQFELQFPESSNGIEYAGFNKLLSTNQSITTNTIEGGVSFVGATMEDPENNLISGTGNLILVTIKDTKSLAVGTKLTASLKNIEFSAPISETDVEPVSMTDVSFNIVIGEAENFLTLNENSLIVPTSTDGNIDIKVKRTLKAGVWSTICLPFNMTKAQVEEAFGSGTQLAEFYDYTATTENNNVTALSVDFVAAEVDGGIYLFANYPYIIKATKDVTEFMINASIDDVELQDAESNTKKSKKAIGKFSGTYLAQTIIPENSLFLNSNKFYYSTGATKMKAFRGYFTFNDVLASLNAASARVNMFVTGEDSNTTSIHAADILPNETGKVYSITGRYLGESENPQQLPKGVYIVNGKKIVK